MKKSFIFPEELAVKICVLLADERILAYDHIIKYALGAEGSMERYFALEAIVDGANGISSKKPTEEDYDAIIDFLNSEAGVNYRSSSRKTRQFISARFSEGFNREDFFTVIRFKISDWGTSSKMRGYIRPETLFGSKFEGYLNQARMGCGESSESSFDVDGFYEAALARAYGI